jgi:hypothetical protein
MCLVIIPLDIKFLVFLMVMHVTIKFYGRKGLCQIDIWMSRLVGLFKWVVMTFGLKSTSATYQRSMNFIFYGLLGVILDIYIDHMSSISWA